MTEAEDILKEIEELLGEKSPEQPIPPARKETGRATNRETGDQAAAKARTARPPRVGTLVQRSDRTNARKLQRLTQQSLPLPARPRRPIAPNNTHPSTATTEPQPPLLMPTLLVPGSLPPPPIRVQVEPGIIFDVPHFAVHVSRKYKIRSPQGHWVMRFSKTGQLRYRRRIN
ncbi:hypothetical protein ACFW04_014887 [Cataglyphis niger]